MSIKREDIVTGAVIKLKGNDNYKQAWVVDRIESDKVCFKNGSESDLDFVLDECYLYQPIHNEAEKLVSSRSNGTYNKISDEATAIINTLGDSEYSYFFSQLANKMARINNGYSVEDSILDIQGYALLELTKFREKQNEQSN